MNKQELFENIKRKQSFLCVGLDTDIKKIPEHLLKEEDPIFAFNKAIIDATAPYCIAYKPNLAFYESMGVKGCIASKRKTMVSTGDRSAKIRTYNYPQGRITDHRINYTIYNLAAFMDGDIQDCIDHLIVAENAERLKESEL